MPGRMGGEKVTVKGLSIVQVAQQEKIVYISGAVPGSVNGSVKLIVDSVVVPTHDDQQE